MRGSALLTRVPSPFVPPAAGVLVGGLLGNALSASWNEMRVPNPLVLGDGDLVVAFNLADVWALTGIGVLMAALAVWLVRNRDLLPTPAHARARPRLTFRRRP